ncbi:Amylo-alpha-16-glucosidase [Caldithrix abyssi DSM 13497]|uniref:Amylo-alpha-16-glucosidase n=1 Tax=Caldithrix abyssi DSM 13497 TaxID=880073 RepID=H1XQ55_CALAY|nr:glycogen debranching enzyme N-terminal domain-containing protein [Caldithrix abyssi]APF18285.1 glycogen debranching enzyme, putative [Caldithrix abyssi DSM 13497]EHO42306.1 Amylo-alpha-16-glucosidase [Caldithrix abyssi DSM 13497]
MEFHKDVLQDIKKAQRYEWLEANSLGAYSSSTICGMNTKREHGLLVTPHPTLNRKVVTLAKFEETIFVENKLYEISTNSYKDSIYPHGYQYLEKFCLDPFPCFFYQIEDRRIRKVTLLLENQNILLVRYELLNQGRPVTLVIKPFIAVRFNDVLNTEIQGLNTDTYLGESFVRWAPRGKMPELYIYFDKGEFIPATLWYHGFVYPKDYKNYQPGPEDLFNPGFFQVDIKPYETFDLFISVNALDKYKLDFEEQYFLESRRRRYHYFDFIPQHNQLKKMTKNFQRTIQIKEDKLNFPISLFNNKSQTFFFMQELSAFIQLSENYQLIKNTIKDLLKTLDAGILPSNYPYVDERPVYNQVDLSLWLIQIVYEYYLKTNELKFVEDVFDRIRSIVDLFQKGTHFNTYADKDGLIFSGERKINVSWIPLKSKEGNVYRYGKLLEVNALWYNALNIMILFANQLGKKRLSFKYKQWIKKVNASFSKKFILPEENGFYDFINSNEENQDFRINQIIPLILPFSPIEPTMAHKALKRIEEELLTPYGLRSRSIYDANDGAANGKNGGSYFNGAIWPWTVSWYIKALLKWPSDKKIDKIWNNYFEPLLSLATNGLIGFIPEAIKIENGLERLGKEDFLPSIASVILAEYQILNGSIPPEEETEITEKATS